MTARIKVAPCRCPRCVRPDRETLWTWRCTGCPAESISKESAVRAADAGRAHLAAEHADEPRYGPGGPIHGPHGDRSVLAPAYALGPVIDRDPLSGSQSDAEGRGVTRVPDRPQTQPQAPPVGPPDPTQPEGTKPMTAHPSADRPSAPHPGGPHD